MMRAAFAEAALAEPVERVGAKVLGAELLVKQGKLDLPITEFSQVQAIARAVQKSVGEGVFGYAVIVANKPESTSGIKA